MFQTTKKSYSTLILGASFLPSARFIKRRISQCLSSLSALSAISQRVTFSLLGDQRIHRRWQETILTTMGCATILYLTSVSPVQAVQLVKPLNDLRPAATTQTTEPPATTESLGPPPVFTPPARNSFQSLPAPQQVQSRSQSDLHKSDSNCNALKSNALDNNFPNKEVPSELHRPFSPTAGRQDAATGLESPQPPQSLQPSQLAPVPQRLNSEQSNSALQMLQNSNSVSPSSAQAQAVDTGGIAVSQGSANAAVSLQPTNNGIGTGTDADQIQKASYLGQISSDGMNYGVPNPEKPTNFLGLGGSNNQSVDSNYAQTNSLDLHPIEKKYAQWWRDSLTSAEVEGEFLEVYQIVSSVPRGPRTEILAAYWNIASAIVKLKIYEDNKQWWKEATEQNRNQYAISIGNAIEAESQLAETEVAVAQAHFSKLAARYGFPQKVRPADAPFTGKYDTKIKEFQNGLPEQLSWLASDIDDKWQLILNDDNAVQWASAQWQNSQRGGSIEQMAAAFQLQQRSMLVLTGHVAQYNQSIAKYALHMGYQKPAAHEVAMLLRNPVIGGQLMDIAADPIFKNQNAIAGSYLVPGNISQVAYYDEYGQPIDATTLSYESADGMMVQAFPPSMNAAQISNPQYAASAQYVAPQYAAPQHLASGYTASNLSQEGSAERNLEYRPTTQRAMPSDPQAWQAAQNAANIRR